MTNRGPVTLAMIAASLVHNEEELNTISALIEADNALRPLINGNVR